MKKRSRRINEGVYVGTDTDLISVRDVLDIYLTWNGIIGYTDAIMEIIETGEAYMSDMDDEDLSDVKRNLGIRDITLESKERPNRRRLKESTEEIDRKLFGSLVKYSDPVFAGATHGVLNDGVLVYKFWARNDEDAKKVFQKFGVKGRPEMDNQGYAIVESKQLNEGPGAGYEIKGKLENVSVNDITIEVEKETDNMIMYVATGDITATLADVECHSYYYGGNIEETPVKIPRLIFTEDKGDEIGNKPTDSDIEDLLNSVEIKTTYGGGWSHSTFDGNLECEDYDIDWSMYATPYTPDLIDIVFTDKGAIFAIDKYATGDNYDAEYMVVGDDYEEVDRSYDNLDDAIEVAKETGMPYVREEKWYWEYNDGEYETVDSLFDSEIVWENEDLEAE